MIVLSFNGFSNGATYFDAYLGRRGRDKHRMIGHDAAAAIFKDGVLVAGPKKSASTASKRLRTFPEMPSTIAPIQMTIG